MRHARKASTGRREDRAKKASLTGDDEQNLLWAESPKAVDCLLERFYEQFPYPEQPNSFEGFADPTLKSVLINQDLGDWAHSSLPSSPTIWVAGCGTNQSITTALMFPQSPVLGSDVSSESLKVCRSQAEQMQIANLKLRCENLNQVNYRNRFDYIVATGVVHHNADPQATLKRLAAALKPTGIMEVMVYNRYHRLITSAFQKVVRILRGQSRPVNFNSDLSLAMRLIDNYPGSSALAEPLTRFLQRRWKKKPRQVVADILIHPVEHSYTVASFTNLAESCGLELLAPCESFNELTQGLAWILNFDDSKVQKRYDALPDIQRWQIINLLLLERSPFLQFYFQRQDSGRPVKSERQICTGFLKTTFVPSVTTTRSYRRGRDGRYRLSAKRRPFAAPPPDGPARRILSAVDGRSSMRAVFRRLGFSTTFHQVNRIRVQLTTSSFPFVKAVQP